MYDHPEDYRSLTYEDWCDFLSTIKVKYERKTESVQIKKIISAREGYISDSNESVRILRKKKAKTCVLRTNKYPQKSHKRHHGIHHYCVLCKKTGMPERKYRSHSADDCTGVRTNRSIKDGLGGPTENSNDAVK